MGEKGGRVRYNRWGESGAGMFTIFTACYCVLANCSHVNLHDTQHTYTLDISTLCTLVDICNVCM